jgi:hypothetical protein
MRTADLEVEREPESRDHLDAFRHNLAAYTVARDDRYTSTHRGARYAMSGRRRRYPQSMSEAPLGHSAAGDHLREGPRLSEEEWTRVVQGMVDFVNGRTIPLEVVKRRIAERSRQLERHRRRSRRAEPHT